MKTIVYIPAYNEEDTIKKAIESIEEAGYEVIVINDGSTDRTVERIPNGIEIFHHMRNEGLGAATRTGISIAYGRGADIAVKFDADLQHCAKDIKSVVKPIEEGEADIVFGSRFTGKILYKMPLIRRVGNFCFTQFMKLITSWNITDAQSGLIAIHRNYMAVFYMPGNYNPPHQILIDAKLKGFRYAEVPITFKKRHAGLSFISLKYPFKALLQMWQVWRGQ